MMLANMVDFYMRQTFNWTAAAAMAMVLLLICFVFIFLLSRVPGGRSILGESQ